MYAVSLIDSNGIERFYTGRAGRYYLSPERLESFTYRTLDDAQYKADMLTKMIGGDCPFRAVPL